MHDEIIYKLALSLTSGVGNVMTRHLISYCGSASAVFKTPRGKLLKIPGIGPKTADALLNRETLRRAEETYQSVAQSRTELLFYTDTAYPKRLKTIADAPVLLYYRGNADLNADKIVALVGTRQATDYGKEVTEAIVADLQRYRSVLVVSGLAFGIDVAAHKAALKHKIPTVGVMASGVDIVYPSAHRSTARQMLEAGGLLTEHPMGVKPDAPYFPARNRIIAGLSDVVIVVEAGVKGGALITADIANSYNRDVFAVPGSLGLSYSEGCNRLIRDHKANIYTGIADLEYLMNWQEDGSATSPAEASDVPDLTEEERQIVTLLRHQREMLLDDLSWQAQVPVGKLASLLLGLELRGVVRALPGKKFTLAMR